MKRYKELFNDPFKEIGATFPNPDRGAFSWIALHPASGENFPDWFLNAQFLRDIDCQMYKDYGERPLLALFEGFSVPPDSEHTPFSIIMAQSISHKYLPLWDSIRSDLLLEYGVLDNTDWVENESYTRVNTGTQDTDTDFENHKAVERTYTNYNETVTDNGTISHSGSKSTDTAIAGFNSGTTRPTTDSNSDIYSDDEYTDVEHEKAITGSYKDSNTGTDKQKAKRTDNLTEHEERIHTRHGNIGITTSQQLLTAEIEFRINFQLRNIMCRDMAHEILLPIY